MIDANYHEGGLPSWAHLGYGRGVSGSIAMGGSLRYNTWGRFGSEGGADPVRFAMQAAGMAAGAPWDDAWNWLQDQVDSAYDWLSDNVSGLPLSLFSTLASIAPFGMFGVTFEIPADLDYDVRALLSGSKWSNSTISYSLPDSRWDYEWINPSADGYRPLNFETEQAVRYALEGYSSYSGGPRMGLTSVEGITNLSLYDAGRGGATLQIAGFSPTSIINRSHGYYPGVPIYNGDVWLDTNARRPGTYTYMVVLHELGHALGLKHPHDSGGALPRMTAGHDSPEYTVMSYGYMYDYPQTYMQYDVAALQAMYGADFTTNSGNTVYRWSPTTGETFVNGIGQGQPERNVILLTIWDGGGNDTYDLSNYGEGAYVDLRPGGYVRFSQQQLASKGGDARTHGNVYNAFQYHGDPRSLIENAIGGAGNDKILGNSARNALTGNAGNDTLRGYDGADTLNGGDGNDGLEGGDGNDVLYGGTGNDWLDGGAGADLMDGGEGWDMVSYLSSATGVVIDLTTNQNGGAAAGDRIFDVEVVQGTNANDTLTSIDRGGGNGAELHGEGGDDGLIGKAGGDRLYGGAGNDWLDGGPGGDLMDGGEGWDVVSYMSASTGVVIDMTTNQNGGAAWGDTIRNVEVVQGTNAADDMTGVDRGGGSGVQLYGEGGNDRLTGAAGGDWLFGGSGNDSLDGRWGSDVLVGGAGADQFRFSTAPGAGNVDRIQDFSLAEGDRIVLDRSVFSGLMLGTLSSAAFATGSVATTAGQHVLYNASTGALCYDADGAGGAAAIQFATLNPGTALSASCFYIV